MELSLPPPSTYRQDPVAVIGLACRLPGNCNSPTALWEFLEQGGVARNEAPESRFNLRAHHDGSRKPKTMRSPGGMFLEDIDPEDFDAQFFGVSHVDAIAMDPQQRQLLEVVYESLENAGVSLEALDGKPIGCFVGSYAVDYSDMHARDPEDRPPSVTVGVGRAILSNRISHFLNIRGPSFTIDTACSGSLVAVDVACRYLNTREITGAIVAASNLYLSPEHNMDEGAMKGAASVSGRCHTFDVKADGYVKAEAVNAVILKRLDDAIRDGDPVRAIIRGSATNSDGRTPGIASPSAEAQAAAIRAAYANAGIADVNATTYIECHGTGTPAGDPVEITGISSVFAESRSPDHPLIIGSIKSNVGHSEPAAGISGLLKTILSMEKGFIPGNPTFQMPNPNIDFETLKVRVPKTTIPWSVVAFRRAGVNSFGYGGSNAHVILDDARPFPGKSPRSHVSSFTSDYDELFADDQASQPFTLVFSANDENSLRAYCKAFCKHLNNPAVVVKLSDLSYTLSERRSRHFHRAYIVSDSTNLDEGEFIFGKKSTYAPRIGFVFTGQGAQWSQMGKGIIETFPAAKSLIQHLDDVLHSLQGAPSWSLLDELVQPRSPKHLRIPEFSQPLATALQLAILAVLKSWGVSPIGVVGHSSGEIAAACAAGLLSPEEAIKIAYFRGQACAKHQANTALGMLAVGLGPDAIQEYICHSADLVQVGCFNSPSSVTLSGDLQELEKIESRLQEDGHFARMLQVNFAYHSKFMADTAVCYEDMLLQNCGPPLALREDVPMFSSVTGKRQDQACDADYWKINMTSPVRFDEALWKMISGREGADFLIEIGPSGALAGPIAQIKKGLADQGSSIRYCAASRRGKDAIKSLFDVAGRLFISGGSVALSKVNKVQDIDGASPSVIVDLPNYVWNHSTKYWHESEASKDWRFRKFSHHDLLGSKILGTSWNAPSWKKVLRVENLHWLKDHRMGQEIVFPAAAFIAMAVEALYQARQATNFIDWSVLFDKYRYRLRNVTFPKALVLQEKGTGHKVMLTLSWHQDSWHEFNISSLTNEAWIEHSHGFICLEEGPRQVAPKSVLSPLTHSTPGHMWYKAMHGVGYNFGPLFQKQLEVESLSGMHKSRSIVSLSEPIEEYQQSSYPMHPVCIDGCLQTVGPSLWKGNRSNVDAVLIPAIIESIVINPTAVRPELGISVTSSAYVGVGRLEHTKNFMSEASVYDPNTGALLFQIAGLRYHELDILERQHASQNYGRIHWKPDITYLTQDKLLDLPTLTEEVIGNPNGRGSFPSHAIQLIDMIAHKTPTLKVMEINMNPYDLTSTWLDRGSFDKSSRTACREYHFAATDTSILMNIQEKYGAQGNTKFSLLDLTRSPRDIQLGMAGMDLIIVNLTSMPEAALANVAQNVHGQLRDEGYALLIEDESSAPNSDFEDAVFVNESDLENGIGSDTIFEANGFSNKIKIQCENLSIHLFEAKPKDAMNLDSILRVDLVHLTNATEVTATLKEALAQLGWHIEEHFYPFPNLQPRSTILLLDELFSPILPTVDDDQWHAIKMLTSNGNRILWVATGSQFEVTKPDNALIHGLSRTMRAEDPMLSLVTLDVESGSGSETVTAIDRILKYLEKHILETTTENEFVERRGVLYTSRVRPDERINQIDKGDRHGADLQIKNLRESETCIRLRCERLGTFDSLRYAEVSEKELPLRDGLIEVDIVAAGLNFKDVAVTMGIVPENEHLLGLEGAGVIRRVGSLVKSLKIGQRVLVYEKGTFANRIQLTPDRVHPLPNSMSFEDAATMPSVYLVTIYGLFHLANMQKNQRVLIHSASGGVGIAAIQLCQYLGAQVFATVGTEEKRKFLTETFGIPPEQIASSRSTAFASQIMSLTQGKGVDIILNSLTGDLLDESWRCISDGGTMIEIGKKDILARNSLSMEPFNRNASYRGVDMSHKQISDPLIARLLSELMALVDKGHVKPISPITVFPFEDIVSAFRYLRSGGHIGKVVISNGLTSSVEVPVRPAARKVVLRSDVSYLIVGGLRGLCGSLAIYLARLGVKHLVILCRSGYADEKSQAVLENISAEGCQVEQFEGDVSVLEDVKRVFKGASVPIKGLIQGAMVLRDKIYTSMTVQEFHETVSCKVKGTWNLHNVALEQKEPLDFFTMLSSISGVIGQKGQANYAAANVFLDSFAAYRQNLALPASSIDLGVVEDVGYVAERSELQASFDTDVWTPINESVLHKILRFSILQQTSTINEAISPQLITGIAIPQKENSPLLRDARFGGLCFGEASSNKLTASKDGSKEIQAFFMLVHAGADSSALLAAAVEIISRQFTNSLRLSEPIEPGKALASYGLDSLAAVEFRNWVRMELGAELSTLEIMDATSLFSLCEKIITKVVLIGSST